MTKTVLTKHVIALVFAGLISLTVSGQEKPEPQKRARPSTGTITGTVLDESGYPIAGAAVSIRPLNSITLGRTVLTDSNGKFLVHSLDNTLYRVWATAPAHVMPELGGSRDIYYRVGDSVDIELTLGGVITGKVINASGSPVVGIRVRALPVSRYRGDPARASSERTTDDRGIYRIYGLSPGAYAVAAGGSGMQSSALNPYDALAPTFAPSSTIDTAAEIVVRAGQESNVDIRFRVEQGRTVSGTVKNAGRSGARVLLRPVQNKGLGATSNSYLNPDTDGFAFYGVTDGEYDLVALSGAGTVASVTSDMTMSEIKRVIVKGTDVTGLEFLLQPMGTISGSIVLEPSTSSECKDKRKPSMSEMVVDLVRNRERGDVEEGSWQRLPAPQAIPNEKGSLLFRSLQPGQYAFRPHWFAPYWYVQSISYDVAPRKAADPSVKADAARSWTVVKSGSRITDLKILLAEGAGSLRGQVTLPDGNDAAMVYLVPSEREDQETVLRFFAAEVDAGGAFSIGNIAPGQYWVIALRTTGSDLTPTNINLPISSEARKNLRQSAVKTNQAIQIKPCQNVENVRVSL